MSALPNAAELPNGAQKFSETRQAERNWCIATSLQIALHYFDVNGVTQADVMKEFCRHHGKDSLLRAVGESHEHLSVDQIFELSKQRNPNSAFGGLVDALERLIKPAEFGILVERKSGDPDFTYTLKDAVARGACFLMPCSNPNGSFHVYAISAYNGNSVVAYEPWSGNFLTRAPAELGANGDWLIVSRAPKG